jgi:hypothetical protein
MDNRVKFFKTANTNTKLTDELIFELKVYAIRVFVQGHRSIKPKNRFLNLGCGESAKTRFDNVDAPRLRFKKSKILSIDL